MRSGSRVARHDPLGDPCAGRRRVAVVGVAFAVHLDELRVIHPVGSEQRLDRTVCMPMNSGTLRQSRMKPRRAPTRTAHCRADGLYVNWNAWRSVRWVQALSPLKASKRFRF
jgi:hypothetical protein